MIDIILSKYVTRNLFTRLFTDGIILNKTYDQICIVFWGVILKQTVGGLLYDKPS